MRTKFLTESLIFSNESYDFLVLATTFSNINSNNDSNQIYFNNENLIQIKISTFVYCINQKSGLILFQNGIIQGCSFASNKLYRQSIFQSKKNANIEYCCACNTSQYSEFIYPNSNECKSLMSNFSETKSRFQSCTGTIGCQTFIQKYINYYKCGNDSAGASIELYKGKIEISYSNYIDIESTSYSNFIIIGTGVNATMRKCFFRIN